MISRRAWLWVVVAGVVVVAAYRVLVLLELGKFGQPTDIGGGFVLLVGYGLVALGLLGLVARWLTAREARRR
jgi:peptidoglycan biosynthesis protein MviN/MurJ (putative lipid II flippase)